MVENKKYAMQINQKSQFEVSMIMSIINFGREDIGSYTCVAKNSIGGVESRIRLYGTQKSFNKNVCLKYKLY